MQAIACRTRGLTLAGLLALSVPAGGCFDASPWPPPNGPTPVATPTPTPSGPASIAIERLSIVSKLPPSGGFDYYWVRFLLRETGGQGGAQIHRVQVTAPDSTDDTGPWCWGGSPLWVPPGGTLDVFHNDAGLRVLGTYCPPAIRARSQSFQLGVRVTFLDSTGGEGVTETTARVEQ